MISTHSSFNIVENREFQNVVHDPDERHAIPSRNPVSKPILNALYLKLDKKLKNILNSTKGY